MPAKFLVSNSSSCQSYATRNTVPEDRRPEAKIVEIQLELLSTVLQLGIAMYLETLL